MSSLHRGDDVESERPLEARRGQHAPRGNLRRLRRDEGTLARVLTIATSVVAIAVGRLILDPFGL